MSSQRELNFDFLRILAMLGIVINHFYGYGMHIFTDFRVDMSNFSGICLWTVLELLKFIVQPCVNCYILITGYFLINKTNFRIEGTWKAWSETWFYSVLIFVVFIALGLFPFSWKLLYQAVFPIFTRQYWFMTSYIVLMLLAPFLSILVEHLTKKQYQWLLVVGFLICFEYPLGQYLDTGLQLPLFIYLFLVGGYIRLYIRKGETNKLWILLSVLMVLMFGYVLGKNIWQGNKSFMVFAMDYSGLVLPESILVFMLFREIHIGKKIGGIISGIVPLSLSVYLIHGHPLLDYYLWRVVYDFLPKTSSWSIILWCFAVSFTIFCACIALDLLRHLAAKPIYRFIKSNILNRLNPFFY